MKYEQAPCITKCIKRYIMLHSSKPVLLSVTPNSCSLSGSLHPAWWAVCVQHGLSQSASICWAASGSGIPVVESMQNFSQEIMACSVSLFSKQLEAMMPRIHLLYPLTLVRGFWDDVMSQAHSFITSTWTFYLQADDGKVVIFQVLLWLGLINLTVIGHSIQQISKIQLSPLLPSLNHRLGFSPKLNWTKIQRRSLRKAVST